MRRNDAGMNGTLKPGSSPTRTGDPFAARPKSLATLANPGRARVQSVPEAAAASNAVGPGADAGAGADRYDEARLMAINMALKGKPRDATDDFLRTHFELSDTNALLDDVYARFSLDV